MVPMNKSKQGIFTVLQNLRLKFNAASYSGKQRAHPFSSDCQHTGPKTGVPCKALNSRLPFPRLQLDNAYNGLIPSYPRIHALALVAARADLMQHGFPQLRHA